MKYLLIFASLIGWFNLLFGQEPHYINYTTEDGLPSSTVYQIKQDKNNSIWFGTDGGISKYNGESFRNYLPNTYKHVGVLRIHEDHNGRLYFLSSSNQIAIYSPVLDSMRLLQMFNENGESIAGIDEILCSFQVLKNGAFKMGFSTDGDYAVVRRDGLVKFYNDTINEGVNIELSEKEIFFYSTDQSKHMTVNGKKNSYNNISSIHLKATVLDEGGIVLGQGNQLTLIRKDSIIETKKFKKTIIEVNTDKKNNVWVSFYAGGTVCYAIEDNKLVKKKHFLKEYSVTGILEDHEGGYWFSTIEKGVFYTPTINIKFFNDQSKLSGLRVTSMTGNSDDEVVVGYANGSITVFRSDTIFGIFNSKNVSNGNTIANIDYDQLNNQYLISTYSNLLILKDGELKPHKFGFISCHHTLSDKIENGFWFKNKEFIGYVRNDSLIYKYPSIQIARRTLLYDLDGTVILTSGDRSLHYNREKEFQKEVIDTKRIALRALYNANDSIVIGHTVVNGGLLIKTPLFKKKIFLNKEKYINAVIFESPNTLWIVTNGGLMRLTFDKGKLLLDDFSREIGVLNNEQRAIYKQNESLWIHSTTGLYVIDKKAIVSIEPTAPSVNSISSVDSTYRNPIENLTFKSNENNLTFKLQAITFKYKGEYKFEYQLDGINEEYTELGGNELNLTNLDYGKYTLNYRIKTVNGIYSPESHYSFEILTPFWATWWFITLIIIGLLLILYLIIRKIFNRILAREKKKSEMRELIHSLRLQSIQSQFNPHFTFNAVSSIQHHISASTVDEAKTYLGMFSSIMRSILMNSEKETIPLAEELKLLETYLKLEKLRFKDKLSYEFRITPSVDPEYDRIPPMIIQPILENAINYGLFNKPEGGTILIDFDVINDVLYCTIEDDGVGFEAVKKIQESKRTRSSGKGLNLVKERLGVNNKEIKDYFEKIDLFDPNGLAIGTKIILKIELND